MKRIIFATAFVLIFVCIAPAISIGYPYLVEEPALQTSLGWDLIPTGMLVTSFDLDQNGCSDFYTLRIVVRNYFSHYNVEQMARMYPNFLIFSVSHDQGGYYYISALHPTLYAIDVNEDGRWDLIYKDALEDGVNGNEMFYDSPTGIFAPNIAKF